MNDPYMDIRIEFHNTEKVYTDSDREYVSHDVQVKITSSELDKAQLYTAGYALIEGVLDASDQDPTHYFIRAIAKAIKEHKDDIMNI